MVKYAEDIVGFTSPEYRFLSNFFIEPDGTHVEREYQQAKCRYTEDRIRFEGKSPYEAKRIGRLLKEEQRVREDWFEVNVDIMWFYVAKKFLDHQELGILLRETYPATLIESNYWHDVFWGVCDGHCRRSGVFVHPPRGANGLGEILMLVRDGQVPTSLESRRQAAQW